MCILNLTLAVSTLLLLSSFVNGVPWYEEKFSHKLKSLTEAEFKWIGTTNGSANDASFEELLDPFLIKRLPGSSNHTAVKLHIIRQMASSGWYIESDAFEEETPYGISPFENIVATLNPDIPRRLVLACHYDSKNFTNFDFIGATDSAVSCSMMLHLASVLKLQLNEHKKNVSQDVTLQFIFFDGEEAFRYWTSEDSIYGSRHLAAKWEAQPFPQFNTDNTNYLHRMDMLILMDLLGAKSPTFCSFLNSTDHWYTELRFIEASLRRSDYWSGSPKSPWHFELVFSPFIVEDDHVPFLTRGVPVIHVMPQPFPVVWHTERDTKASLDFDTIENLSRIFRVFVAKYIHLPFLSE